MTNIRRHHIIAFAFVLIVGIGVKMALLGGRAEAEFNPPTGAGLNIALMHREAGKLPDQKMHDMTFVFSREE